MGKTVSLWLRETRANFLVLAIVLVLIGGGAAYHDGSFRPVLFAITMAGIVLAHISVNLFNEYSDWKSGIDAKTKRTPFSGGSGNLPAGLLDPKQVRHAAWGTLFAAFLIGIGLAWISGWPVLIIMAAGGMATVWYTDYLTKWMIGEFAAGITLGSMVVIGTYFVQTGHITPASVWASIPPGILTFLLLLLNEFPDVEADLTGGRRHLVIVLGKRAAGVVYCIMMLAVFAVVGVGVALGKMPFTAGLALLTAPLAIITVARVLKYSSDTTSLLPALGTNVIVVLATDALLGVGYFLG